MTTRAFSLVLALGALGCGESITPKDPANEPPDAAVSTEDDAAAECACEVGDLVETSEDCRGYCQPAPCGGAFHCDNLPYGAGVHFTLTGPGPWGEGEDAKVERMYEQFSPPDDSAGATCWLRDVDGVSTYFLAVSSGFYDGAPFRSDLLDFQLRMQNVSGAGDYTVGPSDDEEGPYVRVSVGLDEGSERIIASTRKGGSCTIKLTDVLHGTFACEGLAAQSDTDDGTTDLTASYALDGSFHCLSVDYY